MSHVSDIMTADVHAIGPQDSVHVAASLMNELNVGALPVCSGDRLLGMLTDRDITVRAVAAGLNTDAACVSDIMSADVQFCTIDQDADEVMRTMGDKQVRRLPVVDMDMKLVGIVSLGDLALRGPERIEAMVREISQPDSRSSAL